MTKEEVRRCCVTVSQISLYLLNKCIHLSNIENYKNNTRSLITGDDICWFSSHLTHLSFLVTNGQQNNKFTFCEVCWSNNLISTPFFLFCPFGLNSELYHLWTIQFDSFHWAQIIICITGRHMLSIRSAHSLSFSDDCHRHQRSWKMTQTLNKRTMILAVGPVSRLKMTSLSLDRVLG